MPAAAKGAQLYLEFDGVYRSSDMWLNGCFLGHHSSGYTSFRYRIDNATGFNAVGSNVLAVRTDPRGNEGWWYEGGTSAFVHMAQRYIDVKQLLFGRFLQAGYTVTHGCWP